MSLARALRVFEEKGALAGPLESEPNTTGLINETHFVRDAQGNAFVAQRLNDVFDPRVNDNLVRITRHLAAHDVPSFQVVEVEDKPSMNVYSRILTIRSDQGVEMRVLDTTVRKLESAPVE